MDNLASISLVVIALVYVILAIGALIGIVILIKLYGDLKNKLEELKKQIEPYQSKIDDTLYKVQQIVDTAEGITNDVKVLSSKAKETGVEVMDKAKETSIEVMDKTKVSVNEISSLVVDTKKRVENHTNYLFGRVRSIEEKMDDVYAFLVGITKFTSKFFKKEA